MTTRKEALAHIESFAFLAISDATSLVNAIFDHVERVERDQFITDEANKGLGRIIADMKNDRELLKKRIAELEEKQPQTCKSCKYLNDNVCDHPGIPEFYTPQYINYSGCGLLHKAKDSQ